MKKGPKQLQPRGGNHTCRPVKSSPIRAHSRKSPTLLLSFPSVKSPRIRLYPCPPPAPRSHDGGSVVGTPRCRFCLATHRARHARRLDQLGLNGTKSNQIRPQKNKKISVHSRTTIRASEQRHRAPISWRAWEANSRKHLFLLPSGIRVHPCPSVVEGSSTKSDSIRLNPTLKRMIFFLLCRVLSYPANRRRPRFGVRRSMLPSANMAERPLCILPFPC